MAFEEEKKPQYGSPRGMTMQEIENTLTGIANVLRFNASGASPRMRRNYGFLASWAELERLEFGKRETEALSHAYGADGSIRMPVDDAGKYIQPTLAYIVSLQQERLARVEYAKDKQAEELSTGIP